MYIQGGLMLENVLSFESDYITGAHPKILEHLINTNEAVCGCYGQDTYTKSAVEKIKTACKNNDIDVFLLTGGTQTNSIIISSMLKNYEGVVSADTGHIALHEAGAVEYTGHKVLTIPEHSGKIEADELDGYISGFYNDENHEHMVFPGMVYISHPTEYGTLYTKQELKNISQVCEKYNIPLYCDGARLGYAIMSENTDVTLEDISRYCHAFYIGGTKMGALCGEAVVFNKNYTPEHFLTMVKQHGAMIAKSRLTGVQFDALFTDDLYFEIGRHGIEMARKLKNLFMQKGYGLYIDSYTNQQFVVLENAKMNELREKVAFSYWEKLDETHTVVRFATCWSTKDEDIDALEKIL